MNEQTKPSAGALRAAERLDDVGLIFCWKIEEAAHIIDRETGVAELLEAAKACVDLAAVGADLGPKTTGAAKIADGDVERFKQAIAKVDKE